MFFPLVKKKPGSENPGALPESKLVFRKNGKHRALGPTNNLIRGALRHGTHELNGIVNSKNDQICTLLVGDLNDSIDCITMLYPVFYMAPLASKVRNELSELVITILLEAFLIGGVVYTVRQNMHRG